MVEEINYIGGLPGNFFTPHSCSVIPDLSVFVKRECQFFRLMYPRNYEGGEEENSNVRQKISHTSRQETITFAH